MLIITPTARGNVRGRPFLLGSLNTLLHPDEGPRHQDQGHVITPKALPFSMTWEALCHSH